MSDRSLEIASKFLHSQKFKTIKEQVLEYYISRGFSDFPRIWIINKSALEKEPHWLAELERRNFPINAINVLSTEIAYDVENLLQRIYFIWKNYDKIAGLNKKAHNTGDFSLIYSDPKLQIIKFEATDLTLPLKLDRHILLTVDKMPDNTSSKTKLYFTTFDHISEVYNLSDMMSNQDFKSNLKTIIKQEVPDIDSFTVNGIYKLVNDMALISEIHIIIVGYAFMDGVGMFYVKGYN